MQKALLLAVCMSAWGFAVFLMKIAGHRLGPYTSSVFALPGYMCVGLLLLPRADYALSWHHAAAFGVGALYMLGNMAFYKLCQGGDVSQLVPLTSVYIVIPVALGWVLLKEHLTLNRMLGLALAAAAVYLLTMPERGAAGA